MKKILLIVAFICIHTSANAKTFNECAYELHQLNNEIIIDFMYINFLSFQIEQGLEAFRKIELYENEVKEKWLENYIAIKEKELKHNFLFLTGEEFAKWRDKKLEDAVLKDLKVETLTKECDRILEKERGKK